MKKRSLFIFCTLFSFVSHAQVVFDWTKSYGGEGVDLAYAVGVDSSGNIYVSGIFDSDTVDFDPGVGVYNLSPKDIEYDIFIQKLDASGNFLWAKSFGSNGADYMSSMQIDESGNIYMTGEARLCSSDGEFFIQKLDTDGNLLWIKCINDGKSSGLTVFVDNKGNVYTAGGFGKDTVDFDPGANVFNLILNGGEGSDIFIQKLDTDGNFIWAKSMGGDDHGDIIYSLTVDD